MQFLIGSLFGSKCELLDLLLNKGKVMVHLDARREGVEVPERFANDHHLRLKLSLWFGIDDFVYDDDGVRASLSFGGSRFYCVLPWHAIFAMTSHVEPIGYLWPEDLPSELSSQLGPTAAHAQRASEAHVASKPAKGGLRVVEGGRDQQATEEQVAASHPASAVKTDASGSEPEATPPAAPEPVSETDDTDAEPAETGETEGGRRYGHLRVVK